MNSNHLILGWSGMNRSQVFVPESRCICFFLLIFLKSHLKKSHLFVLQFESLSGDTNGNPLQYSFLETPMERGAQQAEVHGVTESDTRGICS